MTFSADVLPLAVGVRHHHSMHRTCLLLLTAGILGAACSGDGLTNLKLVDHIELSLDPARPAYPRGDTTVLRVAVFDKNGAQLSNEGARLRSLAPSIANFRSAGGVIWAISNGTAMFEASLGGATAQIAVNVRGTFHKDFLIERSETWRVADTPHVVTTFISVGALQANSPEVVLTIEPGATVRFRTGAGLGFADYSAASVRIAAGAGAPVIMEADSVPGRTGSWDGVLFQGAGTSELRHLTIRHCGHNWPSGGPSACLWVGGGPQLLLDSVTLSDGHNGLELGASIITPGSKNLSIERMDGFVAHVSAPLFADFPRGGHFTDNAANELVITNGAIRRSGTWWDLGIPLRLAGGAGVPMDANAILTLAPGLHVRADAGAGFSFDGGGIVAGDTAGPPVVLESSGQGWFGIKTEHDSMSALRNVVLKDCGLASYGCLHLAGLCTGRGLVADHVTIQGSKSAGVWLSYCGKFDAASRNLTITGSASVPFDLSFYALEALPAGNYTGNGWDVVRVRDGAQTTHLHNLGIPYALIGGSSTGPTLTVDLGTTIEVDTGKSFDVVSGLVAEGTAAQPITFTSITPGVAGSWMGINIGNPPDGVRLDHVVVADAGGGPAGYAGAIRFGMDPGGVLTNSTIVRSSSCALILFNGNSWTDDYTQPAFGNTFSNVAGPLRCQL